MKTPLNHMMINQDTLADEFDAILNYRATHAGLVAEASQSALVTENNETVVTESNEEIKDEA